MRQRPKLVWANGRKRPAGRSPKGARSNRLTDAAAAIGLFALVTIAIFLLGPEPPFEPSGKLLVGRVGHVVDGDTIDVEGQRVRLLGLDAPELDQTCEDEAGQPWSCGRAAREHLGRLVRGVELRCEPDGHDRYGRLLATCRAGQANLSAAMVADGYAVSSDYGAQQAAAKSKRLGVWQGRFVWPSVWRENDGNVVVAAGGNPSRFDRFLAWLMGLFAN